MEQALNVNELIRLADEIKPLAISYPNSAIDDLYKWLKSLITGTINNAVSIIRNTVSEVSDRVSSVVDSVKSSINSKISTIESSIKQSLASSTASLRYTVQSVQNNITSFINNTLSNIGNIIGSAIDRLRAVISSVSDSIRSLANNLSSAISNAIRSALSSLSYEIKRVVDSIKAAIQTFGDYIFDGIRQLGENIRQSISNTIVSISNNINNIVNGIKSAIGGFVDNIKTVLQNIIQVLGEKIATVYNTVKNTVTQVITGVNEWITSIIMQIKKLYEDIRKLIVEKGIQFLTWIDENIMPIFNRAIETSTMLFEIGKQMFDAVIEGDYDKFNKIFDVGGKAVANELANSAFGSFIYSIMLFYFLLQVRFIAPQYVASRQAVISSGLEAPDFQLVLNAYRFGAASEEDVYNALKLAGISRQNAKLMIEGSKQLPPVGVIQESYLRELISEEEHDKYLKAHGYSDEDIEIFKFLYFQIPPVSDLIRMAVREAFSPDVAEKFGQYEDFPPIFASLAKKIGLSEEWAKRYWASHWDLPSPTMGFEMYHRRIIDEDTLKLLLRALDIMPFWRDKLIELSYNPLTRVDVRRMYKMGVLTEEDVYKSYLDIGYSPKNAQLLTEFTKRYSAPEDSSELDEHRALARSTYSAAYRKNVISRDEYKEMLLGLGYVEDDAELLISIDDVYITQANDLWDENDFNKSYKDLVVRAYKNGVINVNDLKSILMDLGYTESEVLLQVNLLDTENQFYLKSLVADKIGTLYVEFTIDENEVINYMNVFGFSNNEVERYLTEWNINRSLRTRKPSLTDVVRFMRAGMITSEEFADELRGLGYNERYVKMYLNLYGA